MRSFRRCGALRTLFPQSIIMMFTRLPIIFVRVYDYRPSRPLTFAPDGTPQHAGVRPTRWRNRRQRIRRGGKGDVETFHVTLTPSSAETFRRTDLSFRSPERRFLMRWIALDAAAGSVPARAASSGIYSLQQSKSKILKAHLSFRRGGLCGWWPSGWSSGGWRSR